MTPDEVRDAREKLNRTPLGLALLLDVSPEAVEAWEQGTAPVPPFHAQALRYEAAMAERDAALASSGLPECAWATDWAAQPDPVDGEALLRHIQALERHATDCEVCLARERWVEERFGPLPDPPRTGVGRILAPVYRWAFQLSPRLRAILVGALAGVMLASIRIVLVLITRRPSAAVYLAAAKALSVAAWMGAAGGLVYGLVRAPLQRWGRAGDYATGILVVAGALLSIGIPGAIMYETYRDAVSWGVGAAMAVVFGAVLGHSMFRAVDAARAG